MNISPFIKRVKRRVSGRKHSFFAVCAPGLRKTCYREMVEAGFAENDMKMTKGGIEFQARLNTCMAFNLTLRSPSRILMRIAHFKADSFEKLEQKIEGIDWILYLPENCFIKFNITSRKSRLYHSGAIEQRCKKIISEQLNSMDAFTAEERSSQTIHIRAEDNFFTISMDTTGNLLFKRGIKKKVSKAPVRENIASAMLSWTKFSAEDVLIDPMCGSGTFSIEAAMIKSNIPPGFFRNFALQQWPAFNYKTYAYMKKQMQKEFTRFSGREIFASDIDDHALAALKKNRDKHDFCKMIHVSKTDFFKITPPIACPEKKGVIMLNPPYGKRLGKNDNTTLFYREIGKKLNADFKNWRVGIILPSRESRLSLGLRLELKPLFHGGLDIFAGIGKIE